MESAPLPDCGGSAFLAEGTQARERVGSRKPLSARSPGKGWAAPPPGSFFRLLLNLEGRQTLLGNERGAVFLGFLTTRQAPGKGKSCVCLPCPRTGPVGNGSPSPARPRCPRCISHGPRHLYSHLTEAEKESMADILLSPARCSHGAPRPREDSRASRAGSPTAHAPHPRFLCHPAPCGRTEARDRLCLRAMLKRLLGSSFSISSASTPPFLNPLQVAIKSIRKDKIKDEQDLMHIRREIEIMSSLNHPHIIAIHEVFENSSRIVIVMEYASRGDLYDYLSGRQRLSEREARRFFRQIVSAVQHCHQNGVVHRDLKLENILLDANGNIKIADFGLSNLYHQDKFLQTFCGSPLYASPEIVNGKPYTGPEVDSWSLGVLLYILVHGSMPFDGQDHKTLVKQISNGAYRQPPKPSDACGLIRWLLMVNPTRRATLEDVASHWWLNWGYTTRVGEQGAPHEGGHPGSDPGRTSVAQWLWRSSRPLLENGAKVCSFLKQQAPGGRALAPDLERQHSLKKSRKENDMAQTFQGAPAADASPRPGKGGLKLPKGILKKKTSNPAEGARQGPEPGPSPTNPGQAGPLLPKKGILKKARQRESGYYSSPEPSESGELLDAGDVFVNGDTDAGNVFVSGDTVEHKPPPASGRLPHRKGILKHNGKFSHAALEHTAPTTFGSLDELASPHPPARASRPSGAVSEDSILSSESFDQLDLPERLPEPPLRGSVSVDNLLGLEAPPSEGPGSRGLRRWRQDLLGTSCFSLLDCPEGTEDGQQGLRVCSELS